MVLGGTGSVGGGTGWYLVILGQYRSVLIDTWWYWVNMERYWLIYDGTGSAEGGTAYLIIVTDATDAVSVNFSGRCKFLLI